MKCGLVLEGGARRCVFTAGAIDLFLEKGVEFPYVVGVSAGAQSALDFVARQKGRSLAVITHKPKSSLLSVLTMRAALKEELENIIYRYPYGEIPFDFEKYRASSTECEMVATCCETGEATYFSEKRDMGRLFECLHASCSVPGMFSPKLLRDGRHYVDGCIADSLPFERAFSRGCEAAVVISVKGGNEAATDFRKMRILLKKLFEKDFPNFFEALMTRFDRYNAQVDALAEYERQGKAVFIKPDRVYVSAWEESIEKLDAAYQAGRAAAERRLPEILALL